MRTNKITKDKGQFFTKEGQIIYFFFILKQSQREGEGPTQTQNTRDNIFLWKDNLQILFVHLTQSQKAGGGPAQSQKTRDNFFLRKENLQKKYSS